MVMNGHLTGCRRHAKKVKCCKIDLHGVTELFTDSRHRSRIWIPFPSPVDFGVGAQKHAPASEQLHKMISNNKRIKVLIHNREGGQRRLVEVDKTKTLFELEVGVTDICFNLDPPSAVCVRV